MTLEAKRCIILETQGRGDPAIYILEAKKMLQKPFFYDHFTPEDICGMFTPGHFLSIAAFFGSLGLALWLSRRMDSKAVHKVHIAVAVGVAVMEVIKISLRVYKGQGPDDWMPLYFCSLFLFAVWLALAKPKALRTTGYAFMTMGGIAAAVFFIFYPTTSLNMFPIWHPASIHSFVYHWIMCYMGVLVLMKGVYAPRALHGLHYGAFVLAACFAAYFFNEWLGSNCMFLHSAFGLPFLEDILRANHAAYIIIVSLAQGVALYWFSFGIYRLIMRIRSKRHERLRLLT